MNRQSQGFLLDPGAAGAGRERLQGPSQPVDDKGRFFRMRWQKPLAAQVQLQTTGAAVIEICQPNHLDQFFKGAAAENTEMKPGLLDELLQKFPCFRRYLREPWVRHDRRQCPIVIEQQRHGSSALVSSEKVAGRLSQRHDETSAREREGATNLSPATAWRASSSLAASDSNMPAQR